ncbi:MAG: hypothetical protein WD492_12635 [Alkalispirochaeta sp.]
MAIILSTLNDVHRLLWKRHEENGKKKWETEGRQFWNDMLRKLE